MIALTIVLVFVVLPIALLRKSTFCLNIALGWDVLLSAYAGGKPGETLSGRAGSAYLQGHLRGYIFVPVIDFIMGKKGHCIEAVTGDVKRAEAVITDQTRAVS